MGRAYQNRKDFMAKTAVAKTKVYSKFYSVVQHHMETFLAEAQEADPMGWGVPTWVERDFRDHASRGARLRCEILAHGFARRRWRPT